MDNDGIMSDHELARFQRRCFNMDLEPGTLDSLKAVVGRNCPEGISQDNEVFVDSEFVSFLNLNYPSG